MFITYFKREQKNRLSGSIYSNTIFRLHIGHQKIWQVWPESLIWQVLFYSFSFQCSMVSFLAAWTEDSGSLIKTADVWVDDLHKVRVNQSPSFKIDGLWGEQARKGIKLCQNQAKS